MFVAIQNLPEYAKNRRYVVCTVVSGSLWFYGAWDNVERAIDARLMLDNAVLIDREDEREYKQKVC